MPNVYYEEDHPFETDIPSNATCLVIGTFPTYKDNYKNTFKYYYAGEGNMFWNIMEKVFNYTFQYKTGELAVNERKQFLEERRIGITDMHQKCYRKNYSSGDEYLYPILLQDVFSILDKHQGITKLILTSRTDGVGALGLLKTYFLQKNLKLENPVIGKYKILEGSFNFNERGIKILIPYSPSKRMLEDNIATFEELVKMYQVCF